MQRSPVGYDSFYIRFDDTQRRGRLVFRSNYSLRRRHSFELARSVTEADYHSPSNGEKFKVPNRFNKTLEQLTQTATLFPPARAERRYWHAIPDPDPDVSLARSDPVDNAMSIAESIYYFDYSNIYEDWLFDVILPARKDLVRNLWLSVKVKDPGFDELSLGQIICIRMALEELQRFPLEDPHRWSDIEERLRHILERRLGADWEIWDRPWPEEHESRKENKRGA